MSSPATGPHRRAAASFRLASALLVAWILLGPFAPGWAGDVLGSISIISMLAIIFIVIWDFPYGSHTEKGRAAAIVTLLAAVGTLVGFLWLFQSPNEDGFPFGAAFLIMLSLPTVVLSSLLAWKPGGATHPELS